MYIDDINDSTNYGINGLSENYQNLVSAVIVSACNEYRSMHKRLEKNRKVAQKLTFEGSEWKEAVKVIEDIKTQINILRAFFLTSQWFKFLPTVEGKTILKMLDLEIEAEKEAARKDG